MNKKYAVLPCNGLDKSAGPVRANAARRVIFRQTRIVLGLEVVFRSRHAGTIDKRRLIHLRRVRKILA